MHTWRGLATAVAATALLATVVVTPASAAASPGTLARDDEPAPLDEATCHDGGGWWSNHRGVDRCITLVHRSSDRTEIDRDDDTLVGEPFDAGDGTRRQLRGDIRITTTTTVRTTTVALRVEWQRTGSSKDHRGRGRDRRGVDEWRLGTERTVLGQHASTQLTDCSSRTLPARSTKGRRGGWESVPFQTCRDHFGDAAGPVPDYLDPELAARCEFLDPRECLLVWPSNHFTKPDPSTDTGLRVAVDTASTPTNLAGKHVDTTELNRSDGFSPGTAILARVPGIDLERTGVPPLHDLSRSLAPDAPVVVIDATTLERHPVWVELDAGAASDEERVIIIRPAVNFEEGHRYVVALRNLRDSAGVTIPANDVFTAYRDRLPTDVAHVEARRPAMEGIFTRLAKAGVSRRDLHLAWDFTVASERNISERLLHIRDDAFADLGDAAPTFEVTAVEEVAPEVDAQIARRVEGTVQVPLYLTGTGAPASTFNWGPDGLPARNGEITARFTCRVPRSANAASPARISLYGHGLLGSRTEVNAGNVRAFAQEHNIVFCATDWIGMSNEDVPTVIGILQDLSLFHRLADRVQQGILNTLFLGRLMKHPDGLASHPAFQDAEQPLIDTSELFYDGNSQGAIIGGAATAVAQDWTRAVLGVPGMNYSTLLRRSSDWPIYESIMNAAYPRRLDQTILLTAGQAQWDRAETNGYAHHLTHDPYPGTPPHQVLMHVAFADFQVSMWTADVMARTIGARLRQPALAAGRHPDTNPFFDIPSVPGEGYTGSVMVYWDSGTPPPPLTEVPPTEGSDPHSRPRAQASARTQKSAFFEGTFVEVCGADPCLAP